MFDKDIEMTEADEGPTMDLLGVEAVRTEEEREELRRVVDSCFLKWFLPALFIGVPVPCVGLCKLGRTKKGSSPGHVSSWMGILVGNIIHCGIMYTIGLRYFFPRQHHAHWSYTMCRDIWLFWWAIALCSSIIGYIVYHRMYVHIVDPGPPHQLYGLRGHFAAQFLLHFGKLFDPTDATLPIRSSVISSEEITEATDHINKLYGRAGLGPVVAAVAVVASVFTTVLLWRHASAQERRDFDEVDACVPVVLILSFFITHGVFCRLVDKKLGEINRTDEFQRRNVAWVLWRTPITHSYSLWLVRRNPQGAVLALRANERWWELFQYTCPHFRTVARTMLLVTHRMHQSRDGQRDDWLPLDTIFDVLSFLAKPNDELIVNARRRWRLHPIAL
eukprot:Sspe_Gene.24205::Locus_9543_Transcript_1_1_Confidence_1.000_Length_1438::g.24205::m.24205